MLSIQVQPEVLPGTAQYTTVVRGHWAWTAASRGTTGAFSSANSTGVAQAQLMSQGSVVRAKSLHHGPGTGDVDSQGPLSKSMAVPGLRAFRSRVRDSGQYSTRNPCGSSNVLIIFSPHQELCRRSSSHLSFKENTHGKVTEGCSHGGSIPEICADHYAKGPLTSCAAPTV